MMVPEHLLSKPYTHITSGRVRNLESVAFARQFSACVGWLGVAIVMWRLTRCGDCNIRSCLSSHLSSLVNLFDLYLSGPVG